MLTKEFDTNETRMTWLALFTTMGTLVCCALPITLVALGMGATMASLVSNVPFLVTLSQYKILVFGISGFLLALSGWLLYHAERACQTDPKLARLINDSGFTLRSVTVQDGNSEE